MEELQDAIEDAQYMNAIADSTPKPTKAWPKLTAEQIESYTKEILEKDKDAFSAAKICAGSLGFYMFMRFVRAQTGPLPINLALFLEEVAAYRKTFILKNYVAKKIADDYLISGSLGNNTPLVRKADLARIIPADSTSVNWKDYLAPKTSRTSTKIYPSGANAISIYGDHIQKAIAAAQSSDPVASTIFDDVDCIAFGYLDEIYFSAFKASPDWIRYIEFLHTSCQPVTEREFQLFRVLGRGGFGLVSACKNAYSGKLFAMKAMNKKRVKMKKSESLCLNERNILAMIDSEFVACLAYALTSPAEIFLVLDLMMGGDLGFHLSKKGKFSVTETKYFAARILMGIGALHELDIVYRDLKPENILMDELGYTKLSDLGLACKVGSSGISGTCGTRGYWAPEMLRRDANNKREKYFLSVDWFSFGVCIYEFIFGTGPFRSDRAKNWKASTSPRSDDKDKSIDLAIMEMDPEFDPQYFDATLIDLISKLLNKDGKARLGGSSKRHHEIMEHPWFADIDFAALSAILPPFVPSKDLNMASQAEIGHFADDKTANKIVLSEEDQKTYKDWAFVARKGFEKEIVEFLTIEAVHGPIKPVDVPGDGCCVVA